MKTNRIAGLLLATIAACSLQRATAQPLDLTLYPGMIYTNTFDSLGYSTNETIDGTPTGTPGSLAPEWVCYTNAHPTYPGSIVGLNPAGGPLNNWTNSFLGGFCNYASYFDYIGGTNWFTNNTPTTVNANVLPAVAAAFPAITNLLTQTNAQNRCLGIRQTGAFGDPFGAFVLKIANTTGFHNFSLALDFMNLDGTAQRQTIWTVDWGVADPVYYVPTSFYPIATYTNVPGTFHWFHTNIAFPDGTINNISLPAGAPPNTAAVWIRIVALTPSTSANNRETFAIDNVGLSWASGAGGCTPVQITSQPQPTTVYSNASATFSVGVAATSPIFYQWYKDGNGLSDGATGSGSSILGSRSYQILINNVGTADAGQYSCQISNDCSGTVYVTNSTAATFTLTNPPAVSIGYLRTLVNPNASYQATNSSVFWKVTGIITLLTNTTTGNTASYYIQDDTGGVNLFVTGGSTFRPNLGDEVTQIGFLSSFGGVLELTSDLTGAVPNNNATLVQILSNNIANYPVAKLLDWPTEFRTGVTNANAEYNKKGSIVIMTNVFFTNTAPITLGTANTFLKVTNSSGTNGFIEFFGLSTNSLKGKVIPANAFAYSVQGQYIGSTFGTEWNMIGIAKWEDIVFSPLTLNIARSGTTSTITWTAVANTYTYSVQAASSALGPYVPIANALRFTNTAGFYLDVNAADHQYYRVTSP
ncbi:MAG: hypothetical protein C5B50_09510 [Verrucomicrobia bacterium]|nr:MAG: hypothetical protein C5B50_09510 [Verrucomicrobiota bacterium]